MYVSMHASCHKVIFTQPQYQRMIFHSMQEGKSVKETILAVLYCSAMHYCAETAEEAVWVIEKKLVTTFNPKEAPLLLLGAFYTFSMHYTEGCSNFYTLFEAVFLTKKKPSKMTRLSGIIARLSSCREL